MNIALGLWTHLTMYFLIYFLNCLIVLKATLENDTTWLRETINKDSRPVPVIGQEEDGG